MGVFTSEESLNLLGRAREQMALITAEESAESTRVFASIAIESALIELAEGDAPAAAERLISPLAMLVDLAAGADRVRVMPFYARALYLSTEIFRAYFEIMPQDDDRRANDFPLT